MSVVTRDQPTTVLRSGLRLLNGMTGGSPDPSLAGHLERWGAIGHEPDDFVASLETSGLAGHGGAWFPVAAKWRAVAGGGRRRPVVVANGAEGEPASRKDAVLLSCAPHLVLDGLSLAARTLQARRAIAYVPDTVVPTVTRAVAERAAARVDPVPIEVAVAADTYLAGQETAVVRALGPSRRALPSFAALTPIRERGIAGRPTLVHNVETLAHVALIARFGADWFRSLGTSEAPGTMLLTVTGSGTSRVVEAVSGTSLCQAAGVARGELGRTRGVLLGGYGGSWIDSDTFAGLTVSEKAVRRVGATLGPGIVALLPYGVCPLAEMADVVRYMGGQGAGQCGPCVHGLAELADLMEGLAYLSGAAPCTERILEVCNLLEGRGACRHPDGVARFVRSGLSVFAAEVMSHQRYGPCTLTRSARVLPMPAANGRGRRLVSLA